MIEITRDNKLIAMCEKKYADTIAKAISCELGYARFKTDNYIYVYCNGKKLAKMRCENEL